jgi:hypothetical protein
MHGPMARIASVVLGASMLLASSSSWAQVTTTVHVCNSCTTESSLVAEAYSWGIPNMGHYQMFIVTNAAPYNLKKCFQRIYYPYYNVNTVAEHPMSSCPNPGPPLS